jgi:YesN/AraC family two-component response regulator
LRVGYEGLYYFSKVFHKKCLVPPALFRRLSFSG